MSTEFKRAEAELAELSNLLTTLNTTDSVTRSDVVRIGNLAKALEDAVTIVRRKRLETIDVEDDGVIRQVPKYYGPKMLERVLAFEENALKAKELLERFNNQTKTIKEDVTIPTTQLESKSAANEFNPILKPSTVVRSSEAVETERKRQQEEEAAKKALAAAQSLDIRTDDDPLFQEKQLFGRLIFEKGLNGFANQIQSVDIARRKQLGSILDVIVRHPENNQYRTLSTSNPAVKELLGGLGVRECLGALGFRVQLMKIGKEDSEAVVYFLPEPSVENEFEQWSSWFDAIKGALECIKSLK